MTKKHYEEEEEGQKEFFDNFGIPYKDDASILIDYTDGVYNGNIFEFKKYISNPNKVLFQAIKYLSNLRIKGESVPATILLISLNSTEIYVYHSEDYRSDIQKVYFGSASKNNEGLIAGDPLTIYDYSKSTDSSAVRKILKSQKTINEMYMPIDIDENCIVGWAERYYAELPKANKGDFLGDNTGVSVKVIGEIREPKHFKGLINPYTDKTNEKFKYLMDCLNDRLSKKDLGAFYTPEPYAEKAAELVQLAVKKVPEKNDYIILDRCAGTGNLESALINLKDKNGDKLISHCVVSTYEYYEYKVLEERIGDLVREIIPPTEANVIYENGKVSNADALSEDYINDPIIKKYLDDDHCTIILFENPPYQNSSSTEKINTKRKELWMTKEFKKKGLPYLSNKHTAANDLSTLFIWSGFYFYLRQPTDSYIVFSPIMYWKADGLVNKNFVKGFLFNRKYFHASESTISCILWDNIDSDISSISLDIIDIDDDNNTVFINNINIPKVYKKVAQYNDRRPVAGPKNGTVCDSKGSDAYSAAKQKKCFSVYSDEWIAYIVTKGFTFNAQAKFLHRVPYLTEFAKHDGYYLHKDNYLEKLPIWVSKYLPQDNWYDKNIYCTTADGGDKYKQDYEFIKSCLIFTCLSNQNKCLSFDSADGHHYKNELCFDKGTIASEDLRKYKLDKDEKELMDLWNKIIKESKYIASIKKYCKKTDTLGIYQITKDLNTFHVEGSGKDKQKIYDYPELNGDLNSLRTRLKEYYKSHITQKMFKYELIK